MKLFSISGEQLERVLSNPFKLEKDIQSLVEANTDTVFGLDFVRSELTIDKFRLDTLCYDNVNNAFVIIEYKRDQNFSVIDQGYTYLSLMLNNKAEFILEYNESKKESLKRKDIDWSQSRVIFVSPRFTEYQKHSVNFHNIPFELWEITRFKNDMIGFNKVETSSDVDISTTSINETSLVKQVSKEVIKYDENYHLYKSKNRPEFVIELYHKLKERVLQLGDDVELSVSKLTIGFKRHRPFTDFIVYNKGLGIVLNVKKGELNDHLNLTEDLSDKGHWGNGDYRIWIKTEEEIEYALYLIKQAYVALEGK